MTEPDSAVPLPAPSIGDRVAAALRLLLPLLAAPLLLGLLLGGRTAAMGATLGAFGCFLIAAGAGWRRAAWLILTALLIAAFAGSQHLEPTWVIVLALAGVATGMAGAVGLMPQIAVVGILITVAPELPTAADVGQFLVFGVLGALAGVLLSRRAGLPAVRPGTTVPVGTAVVLSVAIGAAVGVGAWIATQWDSEHAYWLPLMVFLLVMPSAGRSLRQRAGDRTAGTLLGAVAVLALLPLDLPVGVELLLGFSALVAAFVFPTPLWLNASLSAAAIILLLTAGNEEAGALVSIDRITATGLGSLLLLCIAGATALLGRFVAAGERALVQRYRPPGADSVTASTSDRDDPDA